MSEVRHGFHSPITLLHEWRDRADGARLREALVLGYTHDLVFLERHFVPTARALGARVTVVGDAGQSLHDPVDVRHAGRSYQHGHAVCGGAFHPKLVVLVGDEDVVAAVGSGNPTMSGWGHNMELWLVLRTSTRRGPAAQRDLADWLVELPDVVRMPTWIADAVRVVGGHVRPDEVDGSLPELRIFGNLRRSVLSHLPGTRVDALRVSSPFYDPRGAALRALVDRARPTQVDIALQPRLSRYDADALVRATTTASAVRYRVLDEERTYHGKLVEWSADGVTTALVGSANCTAAALLGATAEGGNCELVAVLPVPTSLLPAGWSTTTKPPAAAHPAAERGKPPVVLVLLGARRQEDHVVVELVTTARERVAIESSPDGTPGTWLAFHTWLPTGEGPAALRFPAPEQLGGVVRARVEVDGEQVFSSEVYLTDPVRCLPRSDEPDRPRLVRDYDLGETITDPVLAARFNADLVRLLGQVAQSRTTGAPALRTRSHEVEELSPEDRWGAWLHHVQGVLGDSLTGLVFPAALRLPGGGAQLWAVGVDPDDGQPDEEDGDEGPFQEVEQRGVPQSEHHRFRKWAARWVRAVTGPARPPLELRMTVTLVYLDLLAAGIWGVDDDWRADVRDLVRALDPTDEEAADLPGRAISYQCSLTAVCLALLFQDATPHGGAAHDVIAKAAWEAGRGSAAFADRGLATEYLHHPVQPHARVASESEVDAVISRAESVEDDPSAEVVAACERIGLDVGFREGVWVVEGGFRKPRRAAAQVSTRAGERSAVLVRDVDKAVLLLREGRVLVLLESTIPQWRVYRLSPLSTPESLLSGAEQPPPPAERHGWGTPPSLVGELAERLGVNPALLVAAIAAYR
ncbi:hypothetical protein [Actinosynnema pretiosum]|uniref:Uncharacterized protein n=1 Tax=Actinosynnema pretiosum TaxID=42197 RepID=A0A290ZCB6_9PSEU|nr:hypothetical protein [Actinosynnema pretiosum]ATE56624.1 hypothetical protein CNX65_27845 [Actinosynnema pretiosum]